MEERIKPRHGCLEYVTQQSISIEKETGKKPTIKLITKDMFDSLLRDNRFIDGPFLDNFGGGYGESYYPWRQIYGTVKDGEDKKMVYSEIHKMMQKDISAQLQSIR